MNTQLLNYWRGLTPLEKESLAKSADTSVAYLSQIANGHRMAGAALSAKLKNADKNITDFMLRPDLYAA